MNFPSPEQCRSRAYLHSGGKAINWDIVDAYLTKIKARGHLSEFARRVRIAVATLEKRRKILGLPKLASGRPKMQRLSEGENKIMTLIQGGARPTDVANTLDITIQAVSRTVATVKKKFDLIERTCKACNGYGVQNCLNPSCQGGKGHYHFCDPCKGQGVFPEAPTRADVPQKDPDHGH